VLRRTAACAAAVRLAMPVISVAFFWMSAAKRKSSRCLFSSSMCF
jgi:hypothetical protein